MGAPEGGPAVSGGTAQIGAGGKRNVSPLVAHALVWLLLSTLLKVICAQETPGPAWAA